MRILQVKDKYATNYYDVSTDELLHKICCRILEERLEEGYYGGGEAISDTVIQDKLGLTEKEIEDLPEGEIKREAQARLTMIKTEEKEERKNHIFYENVKKCITIPFKDPRKNKVAEKMVAWQLLQSRGDHEYEQVEMHSVIALEDMFASKRWRE